MSCCHGHCSHCCGWHHGFYPPPYAYPLAYPPEPRQERFMDERSGASNQQDMLEQRIRRLERELEELRRVAGSRST